MKYIALSNIQHNGATYAKDDEVLGLSEEQAEALIEAGVVTTGDAEQDAELGHPGLTDAAARQREIDEADAALNAPVVEDGRSQETTQPDGGTGNPTPLPQQEETTTPPAPQPQPVVTNPLTDPTLADDSLNTGASSTPPSTVQIN